MSASFRIAEHRLNSILSGLKPLAQKPLLPENPAVIQAAKHIYQNYCHVHGIPTPKPYGVVIDQFTYRGHLIFIEYPALLPQECLIPIQQIESLNH